MVLSLDERTREAAVAFARTTKKPGLAAERLQRARERLAEGVAEERDRALVEGLAEGLRARRRPACAACGRPLEDAVSVARGVGPDCWARGRRADIPMSEVRALADDMAAQLGTDRQTLVRAAQAAHAATDGFALPKAERSLIAGAALARAGGADLVPPALRGFGPRTAYRLAVEAAQAVLDG